MLPLFENLDLLNEQLKHKKLFLFLDYDGTLIPGKKAYREARLSVATWKLLDHLSRLEDCKIALVSDRSVKDLKLLTNFKNLSYIGNHGMEIQSDKFNYNADLAKDVRYALWLVYNSIYEELCNVEGIVIDEKKLSLSIHYRMVSAAQVGKIKGIVTKALSEHGTHNLNVNYRRNTIDIKPNGVWNKGWAAAMLLSKYPDHFPLSIGYDSSNEDLFKTFQQTGLNCRVGKSHESLANYYLNNTGEVQQLLAHILEIKRN